MSLSAGLLSAALLLAQAPETPGLVRVRASLSPSAVTASSDGTASMLSGFRFDGGSLDPETAARAFLRVHGGALGVRPVLVKSRTQHIGSRATVRFHEVVDGVAVLGGGIAVVVEDGGMVVMASRGARITSAPQAFRITALAAARLAMKDTPVGTPAKLLSLIHI